MITKKQYVEYLASTPKNCTCTYLAEHLEGVSHDVVNAFLHQKRLLPGEVWQLVKGRIEDGPNVVLIVDDSVHDKRYSRFISLVRAQYSGTEHGVVREIGVVSLVHSGGKEGAFYSIGISQQYSNLPNPQGPECPSYLSAANARARILAGGGPILHWPGPVE